MVCLRLLCICLCLLFLKSVNCNENEKSNTKLLGEAIIRKTPAESTKATCDCGGTVAEKMMRCLFIGVTDPTVHAAIVNTNGRKVPKCGKPNDDNRIVGGETTKAHRYPWVVKLTYMTRFYCGGSLISDRYVMTAGHCVQGFVFLFIQAVLGVQNMCTTNTPPTLTRSVSRAILNGFNPATLDNDIALLKLSSPVPFSNTISPICLPTDTTETYAGDIAKAMGWGTTTEGGNTSCELQEVDLPVLSNEECRKTNYSSSITANMLCAGYDEGGKDSCQGDSGGPLVFEKENERFEQIGIVSYGQGCARPGYPGVYTRVTRYLSFIKKNTKDACYCTKEPEA